MFTSWCYFPKSCNVSGDSNPTCWWTSWDNGRRVMCTSKGGENNQKVEVSTLKMPRLYKKCSCLELWKMSALFIWKGISWWLFSLIFIQVTFSFSAKEADFGGQSIPVGGFAYYISPPSSVTWLRPWLNGWWVGALKTVSRSRSRGRKFPIDWKTTSFISG